LSHPRLDSADGLVQQLGKLLGELRGEQQRQAAQVRELEADVQELQQMLLASERQAAQLANLYVATYQLHASLELDDVRKAICEIAVNLLGAARYALLARDDDGGRFEVVAGSEPRGAPFDGRVYPGGDPLVDAALADGVTRLDAADDGALAVVPLVAQGAVTGALVILGLLPQKASLSVDDRELIDVLAAHAASALLAARMFHERTRKLRTLEGLMQLLQNAER
jgi:nitrate/nitrite-specific signal transduction histidine kinase